MDIATAFPGVSEAKLSALEEETLRHARICFATSDRIIEELGKRCPGVEVHLLRNALDGNAEWPSAGSDGALIGAPGAVERRRTPVVLYAGTVSAWFDVDAIQALKRASPHVLLRVVGPVESELRVPLEALGVEMPGPIPHHKLLAELRTADVLVMPFKVTPLIEGVDPVKLYEYVAMRKPVVSVWYSELAHFQGLVNFYRTPEEFAAEVQRCLEAGAVVSETATAEFMRNNTWNVRGREAISILGRGMSF